MRALFSLGLIVVVVVMIGMLIKKQLNTTVAVPSTAQSAPTMVKPAEVPKQVQQELNNAAAETAKRLEQIEGKQ
jgi:hypothetical protein